MKQTNIILSCLTMAMLASGSVLAQHQSVMEKHRQNANPKIKNAVKLFSQANALSKNEGVKAKPNEENSRLLAVSLYNYDGGASVNQPSDSFALSWHDTIGAGFNYMDYLGYNPFQQLELTPTEELTYYMLKVDSYRTYYWSGTAFENSNKMIQTFDNNDQITLAEGYTFNSSNWDINQVNSYTYNATGTLSASNTAYLSSSWNFDRRDHTYDSNGNLIESISQNNSVDSYYYDAQNNLTKDIHYYYAGGNWIPNYTYDYTYTSGNKTSEVYNYWNGTAWQNSSKTEYIYSGSDLSQSLYFYWNSGLSQWDSSSRNDYSYNSAGLADEIIYYNYNSGTNAWDTSGRYAGTYSGSNLTILTIEAWNGTEWENTTKVDYEYNSYSQLTLVDVYTIWNDVDTAWEKDDWDETYNLYYELFDDGTININNVNKIDFNIFPNPVSNVLNINTGNEQIFAVNIYDNAGRIVRQQQFGTGVQGNIQINVSNLATGAYYIQVNGKNAIGTKRFVVK